MNDPQEDSTVQHETDHEDKTNAANETQPFDPDDYPIRLDPDIECVVGMSYD